MLPALQALIALQELDTAADTARRRRAEIPSVEQQLEQQVSAAASALEQARSLLADNLQARRELEKQVAVIDGRLARFEEHKAAVKTNQEFTALLHEIEVARAGKDTLEDQILALLEEADRIAALVADAEQVLASTRAEADAARAALVAERTAIEQELDRLERARSAQVPGLDAPVLAKYEQLLKQRRMIAVAPLIGEICGACNVKLRPAVSQQVRRGDAVVTCDSCQRILYAPPPAAAPAEGATTAPT